MIAATQHALRCGRNEITVQDIEYAKRFHNSSSQQCQHQ